jgi:hypothetical protein
MLYCCLACGTCIQVLACLCAHFCPKQQAKAKTDGIFLFGREQHGHNQDLVDNSGCCCPCIAACVPVLHCCELTRARRNMRVRMGIKVRIRMRACTCPNVHRLLILRHVAGTVVRGLSFDFVLPVSDGMPRDARNRNADRPDMVMLLDVSGLVLSRVLYGCFVHVPILFSEKQGHLSCSTSFYLSYAVSSLCILLQKYPGIRFGVFASRHLCIRVYFSLAGTRWSPRFCSEKIASLVCRMVGFGVGLHQFKNNPLIVAHCIAATGSCKHISGID